MGRPGGSLVGRVVLIDVDGVGMIVHCGRSVVASDQVSLGVLVSTMSRDVIDPAVIAHGVGERRSGGKLPAHVTAYLTMGLCLFADDDYEEPPWTSHHPDPHPQTESSMINSSYAALIHDVTTSACRQFNRHGRPR